MYTGRPVKVTQGHSKRMAPDPWVYSWRNARNINAMALTVQWLSQLLLAVCLSVCVGFSVCGGMSACCTV